MISNREKIGLRIPPLIFTTSKDAKTKINTFINLCNELESTNPLQAIKYYEQAIELAIKADEEKLKATCRPLEFVIDL